MVVVGSVGRNTGYRWCFALTCSKYRILLIVRTPPSVRFASASSVHSTYIQHRAARASQLSVAEVLIQSGADGELTLPLVANEGAAKGDDS